MVLWCSLKLVLGMLILGPLGRGPDAGPAQQLLVPGPGPVDKNYKVICGW